MVKNLFCPNILKCPIYRYDTEPSSKKKHKLLNISDEEEEYYFCIHLKNLKDRDAPEVSEIENCALIYELNQMIYLSKIGGL